MSMTFDATLKDMGRESPRGFLSEFDQPTTEPLKLLNVDLSTVTASADLIVGIGDPLKEIVHLDFQSSAKAWKHADILVYNALVYAHYHVPVHSIVLLLRPKAAHSNMDGRVTYSVRPGRGHMDFGYEVVPLWERDARVLLAGDVGIAPLAMLGRLPEGLSEEEGLATVARQVVERLLRETSAERAKKLLTEAYLLTGLRVPRTVATRIFQGVRAMHESDTYLAIIDEGQEKATREAILVVGEVRLSPPDEAVRASLGDISDLDRLKRMHRRALEAGSWQEVLETL